MNSPEKQVAPDVLSEADLNRGAVLTANNMFRRQAKANEIALKSIYVGWLFEKLNLTKYR